MQVKRISQTRFKLIFVSIVLAVLGAIAKAFLEDFPYMEMLGGIGTFDGLYLGVKTTNNVKDKKFETEGKE